MLLAILAEREQSDVRQYARLFVPETSIVEGDGVFCDFIQAYASDGETRCAEIGFLNSSLSPTASKIFAPR